MTWISVPFRQAAFSAGLLLVAGLSGACSSSPQQRTADASVAEAGMRVYLDPETGELGPVPAGMDLPLDAEPLAAAELSEPVQTVLPDGSVMMELNGHGQEYFILDIHPDGSRSARCVQDPAAALQAAPAPATPEVR